MAYSPPRAGGGYPGAPSFDERDSYYGGPRGSAGFSPRRGGMEDFSVPMDDPYRRARSPDDDRRKRRRSPSPGGRTDTYIPSYHRERSPPGYRDRRDYGPPGGGDRYDRGGYRGDPYDAYMGAPPASGSGSYDRRPPPSNLPRRSNLRPPSELPYLVPFSYYRDFVREEDPELYDDRAKLDESYKAYRSAFLYKTHQSVWSEIKEMSWCKEKYGIGEEEVAGRKRLREQGRQGKMELFLGALDNGDLDELSFDQKAAPASPPKKEVKLESNEEAKIADPEGTAKTEEQEAEVPKQETNGDENTKMEDADGEEKPVKTETEAIGGSDGQIKTEASEGANEKQQAKAEPATEEEQQNAEDAKQNAEDANEDPNAKRNDDDSVMVPPAFTTIFIKSLSPEISRADLEAHCRQVDGVEYVALGEPNPLKRFHRVGWVVFKPETDMEQAVEKLCESKINNFTLHMHLAEKPTYQRMRTAPNAMSSPERVKQSLEQVKQMISKWEAEADNDNRGSEAIEKRLASIREKLSSEKPAKPEGEQEASGTDAALEETLEKRALDLYIQYLRTVFHTCYYCVNTSDFPEELVKKCVRHVRRAAPATKNGKEKEATWLKNFDDKIQLLVNREGVEAFDYGGESYQDELTKLCKPNIQVEDEGKYRCKQCKKLFKAAPFVEKHIMNKHGEVIGDRLEQLKYFNNYVLDPGHVMPPNLEAPQFNNNAALSMNGGMFMNSGVASTFGAFNQMFNPSFGGGYGMMGFGGAPAAGGYNNMFPGMAGGFNGSFAGGAGGYGGAPLAGGARALGERIGDRGMGYDGMMGGPGGMGGGGAQSMRMNGGPPNKRSRRESYNTAGFANAPPPPPPKGAKIDPRAGRLQAYTDLDGPPASGGGDDMVLDY